jgi:hypothetical protein
VCEWMLQAACLDQSLLKEDLDHFFQDGQEASVVNAHALLQQLPTDASPARTCQCFPPPPSECTRSVFMYVCGRDGPRTGRMASICGSERSSSDSESMAFLNTVSTIFFSSSTGRAPCAPPPPTAPVTASATVTATPYCRGRTRVKVEAGHLLPERFALALAKRKNDHGLIVALHDHLDQFVDVTGTCTSRRPPQPRPRTASAHQPRTRSRRKLRVRASVPGCVAFG